MKEMVLAMVAILLLGVMVILLGLVLAEAVRGYRCRRRALARRRMVLRRVSRRGYRVELVPLFRGREGRN